MNGTPLQYSCLENPWTEKPGRLQSMVSLRAIRDSATSLFLSLFTFMHWRRKWQPTPVFLPGESQRRGSLMGCHLWGHTESDTTEATWWQQQQHGHKHGDLIQYDWCPYNKRDSQECVFRGHVYVRTKQDIFKPRGEALGETKSAGTLVLDFQPPKVQETNFCCLSHSIIFY